MTVTRAQVEGFVNTLARRHSGSVVLTGSASLLLLPGFDAYEDAHTFCGTPEYMERGTATRGDRLPATFSELRAARELPKSTTLPYRRLPPLEGAAERRVRVREGRLEVLVEDPYTTALCKLLRNAAGDYRDVAALCKRGVLDQKLLVRLGERADKKLDGALRATLRRLAAA